VRIEREYHATAEELFQAFVDVDRLRQWFRPARGLAAPRARACDGPPGAELVFATPVGDVTLRFVFHRREPARALSFDLVRNDASGTHSSRVAVTLQRIAGSDRTLLVLQHDGLPPEHAAEAEAGWRHALGRLIGACPAALDAHCGAFARIGGFRSVFGGLWPDRADAAAVQATKRAAGVLDAADDARFAHWRDKGYVALPGAVPAAAIDAFRAEVARDWQRGNAAVTIELCDGEGGNHRMRPELRDRPHKVLDYHAVSPNARDIQFAPAIRRFLEQLFERPPMACQSLLFGYGTEQAMHQDTAYVVMRSPMQFVGCWVALEDIAEGSGELHYYEGSHRIPEFLWFGRSRSRPPGYEDDAEFLAWVDERSREAGCKKVVFRPKKGDALIWHADLVHGGSPRLRRELTRWSLVTHFCPVDVDPAWMHDEQTRRRHEHAPGAYYCHLGL